MAGDKDEGRGAGQKQGVGRQNNGDKVLQPMKRR